MEGGVGERVRRGEWGDGRTIGRRKKKNKAHKFPIG